MILGTLIGFGVLMALAAAVIAAVAVMVTLAVAIGVAAVKLVLLPFRVLFGLLFLPFFLLKVILGLLFLPFAIVGAVLAGIAALLIGTAFIAVPVVPLLALAVVVWAVVKMASRTAVARA